MALVALPRYLERNCPQAIRWPRVSASRSGYSISSSQVGFPRFKKTSLALCQCGCTPALSCSHVGRQDPALVSDWRQGWSRKLGPRGRAIKISRESSVDKKEEQEDEDDTELCPVECVREFRSWSEFDEILKYANEQNALVVVDFFKTACGSCRYIETGFAKLCKGAGNTDVTVIFLKHNVMDEYEEQSEVAERFKIRVVPLFHFYKDGKLVESFATREKTKILEAICRHTGLHLEDVSIPRGV